MPDGGGDMNVEVADAVVDVAAVVLIDDNMGVFAGVLPINALGDEKVVTVLLGPLFGPGGMVNDTDDAGC